MPRIIILGSLFFFAVTSYFSYSSMGPFHSPDEMSNAFFIQTFAQTGSLRVAEPFNGVAENLIHPRAVNVVHGDLVPGGFLGMPLLYGLLGRMLGLWIIPFLTPLIATLALLFFYLLIRHFFDERIARWSFLFSLVHPAVLYYTSRSLFPNVLFLSLVTIGIALLVLWRERIWAWAGAGALLGFAIGVRTSELGWLLGILLLGAWFSRTTVSWRRMGIFGIAAMLALAPVLFANTATFGGPFATGYAQVDSDVLPANVAWHFSLPWLNALLAFFMPFGITWSVLVEHAYDYLVFFFWWMTVPAVLGIVVCTRTLKHWSTKTRVFLHACAFVLLWLVFYYGSWVFRDSTLSGPTIGTSFVRYWLPIFLFSIPFMAFAIDGIRQPWARRGSALAIVLFSLTTVFVLGDESLLVMRATQTRNRGIAAALQQATPENSIVVIRRSDKFLFPNRRVIVYDPLDEAKIRRVVSTLVAHTPLYVLTMNGEPSLPLVGEDGHVMRRTHVRFIDGAHLEQLEMR